MKHVTLLSDMGSHDASVAYVKSQLSFEVDVLITDISHSVLQYDLQQAAYLMLASYSHFPKGSVHVALIDVFYTKNPLLLLFERDGHYFLVPDNGLLSLMFNGVESVCLCYESVEEHGFYDWLLHIRKMIGMLHVDPSIIKGLPPLPLRDIRKANELKPLDNGVECRVIHIDHYGNTVLNITQEQFQLLAAAGPFTINIARGDDVRVITPNYKDVDKGQVICRFNKTGYLEIGVKYGRASDLFGLQTSKGSNIPKATIRMFFGSPENEINPRIEEFFESMERVGRMIKEERI